MTTFLETPRAICLASIGRERLASLRKLLSPGEISCLICVPNRQQTNLLPVTMQLINLIDESTLFVGDLDPKKLADCASVNGADLRRLYHVDSLNCDDLECFADQFQQVILWLPPNSQRGHETLQLAQKLASAGAGGLVCGYATVSTDRHMQTIARSPIAGITEQAARTWLLCDPTRSRTQVIQPKVDPECDRGFAVVIDGDKATIGDQLPAGHNALGSVRFSDRGCNHE
ncbi:MAG: hypothetical protein SFX18_10165 [Pirellulales bacterium]|nr:hypothetical protein [Pirellulales bacterium]